MLSRRRCELAGNFRFLNPFSFYSLVTACKVRASALVLTLLLLLPFFFLNNICIVKAVGQGSLSGWSYCRKCIINPSPNAGMNYQVKIRAFYSEPKVENIVPSAELISTLPVPSGTSIISAQAAIYWNGAYLHVWYGATGGGEIGDDIYYTKTSDFINWDTPVKVIDRPSPEGIRDPTIFVEGDYIYLFCQCFDGSNYRPIRLYKIAKTADFTNPANYVYVGVPIDVGSSEQFDDLWVASPCVVKIGSTYWMAYEAKKSDGTFSIGRAYTTNIEGSWTKDGQMRDSQGNVIYNPYSSTYDIVPDTFPDTDTLFIHFTTGSVWVVRYMTDDIPNNNMTLSSTNCQPNDGYANHNNFAHIGFINDVYMFLMQSWDTTAYLRLYKVMPEWVSLNQHCRTDFGDVRFTKSDGTTLLDYWIEEKVDGDYADFWVEVADDLSTNPATIYIYYGKSDATTTSNGDNTFLFFDDFPGSTLDSNKWTAVIKGVGGSVTVSNSECIPNPQDDTVSSASILSTQTFQNGINIRIKRKYTNGTEYYLDTSLGSGNVVDENGGTSDWWHTTLQGGYWWFYQTQTGGFGAGGNGLYRMPTSGQKVALSIGTSDLFDASYRIHDLTYDSSGKLKWIVDGSLRYSATDTTFLNYDKKILISQGEYTTGYGADSVIDYVFVRKYVDPEPSHGTWGNEETLSEYVLIDQVFVSDERADVDSIQILGFHAKWSNNGSDLTGGSIFINNTEYAINSTGWITFAVDSPVVKKDVWIVTGVNCNGITTYTQTAPTPSIIWDQIKITEGDITKEFLMLGESVTIWFRAVYEYDNSLFSNTNGTIYLNENTMTWSDVNNRWEYTYATNTTGTVAFAVSAIFDSSQDLTTINDAVGAKTITVWSMPFSIILNSVITELAFNSTSKTITFTVSGPDGTIGYTNVTIAKTLIENINDLKIYLDGNQINYTTTSTEYTWLIHFTYTHSTHKVLITLSPTQANTQNADHQKTITVFSATLIAIIAAILLAYKKGHKKLA
jgi:hypothetical protein